MCSCGEPRRCYYVSYKHDEHGSDSLGALFHSLESARREIAQIEKDPSKAGWAEWLKDAVLWVSDCDGNIY